MYFNCISNMDFAKLVQLFLIIITIQGSRFFCFAQHHYCIRTKQYSKIVPNSEFDHKWKCCNDTLYDVEDENCCNDTTIFTKSTHLCCNNKVVSSSQCLHSSGLPNSQCCGQMSYNRKTHISCQGEVMPLSEADIEKCCSWETISRNRQTYMETYVCCQGNITIISPPNVPRWMYSCCDSIGYNVKTHLCCGGKVIKIDLQKYSCCANTIIENSNLDCCAKRHSEKETIINKSTHMCCGHFRVVPLAANLTSSKDPNAKCCGNLSINAKYEKCCLNNGKSHVSQLPNERTNRRIIPLQQPGCCGNTSFNEHVHTCCKGKLLPLPTGISHSSDPDSSCCSHVPYNRKTSLCCNGKLVQFPSDVTDWINAGCCDLHIPYNTQTHSCCNYRTIYNISTHTCCMNEVTPLAQGLKSQNDLDAECCRDKSFNKQSHVCSSGQILPKSEANAEKCCPTPGFKLWRHFVCCNGSLTVFPKSGNPWLSCCGDKGYNGHEYKCCDGKLNKFEGSPGLYQYTSCCGHHGYDHRKNICCNGAITPFPDNIKFAWQLSCCGSQTYVNNKYKCCNNRVVVIPVAKLYRDVECCGMELYDKKEYHCCNGEMAMTDQCV